MEHSICSGNKIGNQFGTMRRMTIDNQKHRPVGVVQQTLEEFDKDCGSDRSLDGHESHLPPGGDRRNKVETEPGARRLHDGSLAPYRPSGTGVMIGTYTGLIPEIDDRLSFLGLRLDHRILLRKPFLHPPIRTFLKGTPKRLLWSQAQLIQQAAYRRLAQPNAVLLVDHLPHHAAGPQYEGETKLPRVLRRYRIVRPLQLSSVEFRPPASPTMGPQGTPTPCPVFCQPSKNSADANPEYLGHHRRGFAILCRRNTTTTQVRQPIPFQFSGICRFHDGVITSFIEYVRLNMRRLVII